MMILYIKNIGMNLTIILLSNCNSDEQVPIYNSNKGFRQVCAGIFSGYSSVDLPELLRTASVVTALYLY